MRSPLAAGTHHQRLAGWQTGQGGGKARRVDALALGSLGHSAKAALGSTARKRGEGEPGAARHRQPPQWREAIAREHGFTDLDEHDDVEANILLLLEGIHPQSRTFVEPSVQIQRRIEEVLKADKSLPEDERNQALEDLAGALNSAQPVQFPANVELVRKYYDKIQAVLQ
jgi:hypothetical protein